MLFAVEFWFMIQNALPNDDPKVSSIPPGTTRNLYLNYTAIQQDADKVFPFWAEGPNYLYVELAPISDPLAVESSKIYIGVAGAPLWEREEEYCFPGPNLFHLPYPREEWNNDPESAGACLYNISIDIAEAPAFRRICVQPVIITSGGGNLTGSLGASPLTFNFSAGGLLSVVLYGSNVEFANLSVMMDPDTPFSTVLKAVVSDFDMKLPTQTVARVLTDSDYLQFQANLEPGFHRISFQGDGYFSFKILNTYGSWDDDSLSDVEEAMFEGSLPRVDIFHTSIYGTKTEEIRNQNSLDYLDGGTFTEEWVLGAIKFTIPASFGQVFGGYPLDTWVVVSQGVYTNLSLNNVPVEPSNLSLSGFSSDSEEPILITEEDGTQILRAKKDIVQLSNHYLGDLLPGTHTLEYTYLNEPFTEPEITIYVHDIPVVITSSGTMSDYDADADFDGLPNQYDTSPAASLLYESDTLLQLVVPVPSDGTEDVQIEFSVRPPAGEWNRSAETFRWRVGEKNSPLVKIRPTLILYGPADDVVVDPLLFWDVPCWDTLAELATYLGEDGIPLPIKSYNLVMTTADGTQHYNYASGAAEFTGDADPLPLIKSAGSMGQYHIIFAEESQGSWSFGPFDYSRDSEALTDGALDLRIRWVWSIIEVDEEGVELSSLGFYPIPSNLTIQAITMRTFSDANYVVGAPRSASEASILTAYATRPDVPISVSGSPAAPGKAGMNDDLRNAIIGEGFGLRYLPSYNYDSQDKSTWGVVERATYDYHTAYYYLDANFSRVAIGEFPAGWIYNEADSAQGAFARVEDVVWGDSRVLSLYDNSGTGIGRPEVIADIAPMHAGSANFTISLGDTACVAEVGFFYNYTSGTWPVATQYLCFQKGPYNILLDYDQLRGCYNVTIRQLAGGNWEHLNLPMQNATCAPNQFRLRVLPSSGAYEMMAPYASIGNLKIWSRRSEQVSQEAGITLYCVTERSNDVLWAINQSILFQQQIHERVLFYPGNDVAHLLPGSSLMDFSVPSWGGISGEVTIEDWYHGHGNALRFTSPNSCATKSFTPLAEGSLVFEFCPSTGLQAEFSIGSVEGVDAASLQVISVGDRSYLQYKNGSEEEFDWVNLCEVWAGEWFTVQLYEFDLTAQNPNFTIFVDGAYAGSASDVPLLNDVAVIANVKITMKAGDGGLLFDAAQLLPSEDSETNQPSLPLDFPSVYFGVSTSRVYFSTIADRYDGEYSFLDEELQGPKGTVFSTFFTDVLHERECGEIEALPVSICYRPTTESSYYLSQRFQFSDALNISYVSSGSLPLAYLPNSPACPYSWLIGDIPDQGIYEYSVTLETPRWLLKDNGVPVILFNELKGDIIRSIVDMRPGEVDFLAQLFERHSGPEFGFIWEISNEIIETSMEIEKVMIQSKYTLGAMERSPEFKNVLDGWKSNKYLPNWKRSSAYEKFYDQGYWAFDQATGEWNYIRSRVPIEWTVNDILAFADNFIKASAGLAKMLRAEIGDTIELYRQVILPETWWGKYIKTHVDFFDQVLAEKIQARTKDAQLVSSLRSGSLPKNFAFLPDEIELLPKEIFYEVPISSEDSWIDPDDPRGALNDGGYLRPQMSGYVGNPTATDMSIVTEGVWKRGCYIKKIDIIVTWKEKCQALQRACTGKPENSFIFKSGRYKMPIGSKPGAKIKGNLFWWRILGMPPVPSLGDWNLYMQKVSAGTVASGLGGSESWLSDEQVEAINNGRTTLIRIYAEPGSRWEKLHGVEAFVYKDAGGVLRCEGMYYGLDWSLNPSYRPQGSIESGDSMIYSARAWMRLTWDLLEYAGAYYGKGSAFTDKNGLWLKQDTNPYYALVKQYILVWRMLEFEGATPPVRIAQYCDDVALPAVNGKKIIPLGLGAPHEYRKGGKGPIRELTNLYRGWDGGGSVYEGSLCERAFNAIDAIHNVNKAPPGMTSFNYFKKHKTAGKSSAVKTILRKNPNYLTEAECADLKIDEDIKYFLMLCAVAQGYTDYEGPASLSASTRVRILPSDFEAKMTSLLSGYQTKYGLAHLVVGSQFRVEFPYATIERLMQSPLKGFDGLDKINAKRVAKGLPEARNFDHLAYLSLTEGGLADEYVFAKLLGQQPQCVPTPILEPGGSRHLYEQASAGVKFRGEVSKSKLKITTMPQDLWLLSPTDGEYSVLRFMYERNVFDGLSGPTKTQGRVVRDFSSWLRASVSSPRDTWYDLTDQIAIRRVVGEGGMRTYLEIEYLRPAQGAPSIPVSAKARTDSYATGEVFKYIWVQGEGAMTRQEALNKRLINPIDPDNKGTGSGPASTPRPGGPGDKPSSAGAPGKAASKSAAKQAQTLTESLDSYRRSRTNQDPSSGDAPQGGEKGKRQAERLSNRLAQDLDAGGQSLMELTVDELEARLDAEEAYSRVVPKDLLGNVGDYGVRQFLGSIAYQTEIDDAIPLIRGMAEFLDQVYRNIEEFEAETTGTSPGRRLGKAQVQADVERYIQLRWGVTDNALTLIWTTIWSVGHLMDQTKNQNANRPGAILQAGMSSAMVLAKAYSLGKAIDVRAFMPKWRVEREYVSVKRYDPGASKAFDSFKFPLLMDLLFMIPDVWDMTAMLEEHGVPARVAISRAIMQFLPPLLMEAVLDFVVSLVISTVVASTSGIWAAVLSSSAAGGAIGMGIAALCTLLWNLLVDWMNSQYNNSVAISYASEHQTLTWEPALAKHGGLLVGDEVYYSVAWNNTGASSIWYRQKVSAGTSATLWGQWH